jgi:regulator of sigma E protease
MEYVIGAVTHTLPLLVGVTLLVFVHELGHYLVARWAGVRVEIFSIGFGPELFGWRDRHGTRWRVSAIPLGGYVMMFGDPDAISSPPDTTSTLTPAEQAVTLHHQPLPKRAAIIAAGPIANFVYTVVILAALFMTVGQGVLPAAVESVVPGSAADQAGIAAGDEFVAADGHALKSFYDLVEIVRQNTGMPIEFTVRRDGREIAIAVTPRLVEDADAGGTTDRHRQLGVKPPKQIFVREAPVTAVAASVEQSWDMAGQMLASFGQVLSGARSSRDIGGLVSAGAMLDTAAQFGFASFLSMTALWSLNLGLVNLFPIPVLDGGHLLFYAAEAVLGRPLGRRTQELGFKIGLALVLTLMVFANGNDLVHRVIPYLKHLFT